MATDHHRWGLDQATQAGQWRIDNPPPDSQYMRLRRHAIRTKVITKNGQPYLRRWYLHDSPRCSLLLHHLCQPDADRWLHDHPWWFVAVVLRGGYTQTRTTRRGQRTVRVRRVNVIRGGTFHRIETVDPDTWTLVLTGRHRRVWSYRVPWTEATPGNWR